MKKFFLLLDFICKGRRDKIEAPINSRRGNVIGFNSDNLDLAYNMFESISPR